MLEARDLCTPNHYVFKYKFRHNVPCILRKPDGDGVGACREQSTGQYVDRPVDQRLHTTSA